MRNSLRGDVLSATVTPEEHASSTARNWRPNVSQETYAARRHFAPLTIEEKVTYRKWRRATMMFYGIFAIVITVHLIAIGSVNTSANVNNKDAYSAIASATPRSALTRR